ncbi:hypothetical protein [Bradyrhizobium sp. BR 1433]|uniref:hypothetical protein n=1 Tax=Bradyrhizobium sp. BR 1433 TaxID=3447967 RepID=UPI003EE7AE9F
MTQAIRTSTTRRQFSKLLAGLAGAAAVPVAAMAAASPDDDSALLRLEEKIFDAWRAAIAPYEEIHRLDDIWRREAGRLYEEMKQGRLTLTDDERWQIVWAMPEWKEHGRLVELSNGHFDRMFDLIDEMWALPAYTEAGRKAKVAVALYCVLDWRDRDDELDYRELMARRLLIELVGGEAASSLRESFAA